MRPRVLLDQNVPRVLCAFLRRNRPEWLVRHVGDVGLWGASDAEIMAWAQRDRSVVVTFDEDFADARMFPAGTHAGVVRLRVWPTSVENTEEALGRLLREIPNADLPSSLVVDSNRIRLRRSARHS